MPRCAGSRKTSFSAGRVPSADIPTALNSDYKVKLGDCSIAVSSEDRLRRVSPVAVHPGEGPLTERIARVQPVQRELVFMPLRLDPSIDRREAGKQSFDRGVGFP